MTSKISLVIITKDRPADLAHCYKSLNKLTVYPDELILIDSSTNSKSRLLTKRFTTRTPYPVRYIHESRLGFPIARNRGIASARYQWVVFTDDDCLVDPDFIQAAKRAIYKHPRAAAIAGQSNSYYKHNLLSHLATFNENHWKSRVRVSAHIYDLETLDNKNIAYNMTFFKKHRISYDETRTLYDGASDDCDLGMQIQQAGGKAYYEKHMIVYHKDLTTLQAYTRRLLKRSSAHATYENKWRVYRQKNISKKINRVRFLNFFRQYSLSYALSATEQVGLFILLIYTSFAVKIIKRAQKIRLYLIK